MVNITTGKNAGGRYFNIGQVILISIIYEVDIVRLFYYEAYAVFKPIMEAEKGFLK